MTSGRVECTGRLCSTVGTSPGSLFVSASTVSKVLLGILMELLVLVLLVLRVESWDDLHWVWLLVGYLPLHVVCLWEHV